MQSTHLRDSFLKVVAGNKASLGSYSPKLKRWTFTQEQIAGLGWLHDRLRMDDRVIGETQIAYVLATVAHETGRKYQPIHEIMARPGTKLAAIQARYAPYTGRGYVQITWKANYEKLDKLLGLKDQLVKNPDLALDQGIAYEILVLGMSKGLFRSGHGLDRYFHAGATDYLHARNIVNGGLDRAADIARLAEIFQAALNQR